jgi:hypothetical protein
MEKTNLFRSNDVPAAENHEEMLFQRKQPLLSNVNFVPSLLRKQIKSLEPLVSDEVEVVHQESDVSLALAGRPAWENGSVIRKYLSEREQWLNTWKMAVSQAKTFVTLTELQRELLQWELDYQEGLSSLLREKLHSVEAANSRDALDYQRWRQLLPDDTWNDSWNSLLNEPDALPTAIYQKVLAEAGRCQKLLDIYNREK